MSSSRQGEKEAESTCFKSATAALCLSFAALVVRSFETAVRQMSAARGERQALRLSSRSSYRKSTGLIFASQPRRGCFVSENASLAPVADVPSVICGGPCAVQTSSLSSRMAAYREWLVLVSGGHPIRRWRCDARVRPHSHPSSTAPTALSPRRRTDPRLGRSFLCERRVTSARRASAATVCSGGGVEEKMNAN